MMESVITVLHVLTCFFIIMVVLLQSGKGGGLSGAFGGGAGAALGQASATNVLTKLTGYAAALFMVTSMVLAIYSSPSSGDGDSLEAAAAANVAASAASAASAAPKTGADVPKEEEAPADK